jgi:hypothetical protein
MRKFIITIGIVIAGLAFVAKHVDAKTFTLTESEVKKACGDQLRSGGGAFGCTKAGGGHVRDYGCNSDPKNGNTGCREIILRKAPDPGKGQPVTSGGTKQSGGEYTPPKHRTPVTPVNGGATQGKSGGTTTGQSSNTGKH